MPRGAATGATAPRRVLPPPRPAVVAQAPPETRGLGFGGFVLGLLLLAGVLGLVYAFAVGWFDDLFSFASGAIGQPPTAVVEQPTEGPTPLPEVQVPVLENRTEQEAIAQLQIAGLTTGEISRVNNATAPPGLVFDQFPDAGTVVTQTSVVTFAVSLGPEAVEVPDVVGFRASQAQQTLQSAGFQVEVVELRCNAEMSAGFVTRTDPAPPARPNKGETITMYVSLGNNTVMPDVTGLSLDEATRVLGLAELGLSFADMQGPDKIPQYDQIAPNTVVSSVPRGGDTVPCGSGVTLGVRAP
jgi:serine/threonine-protein kinase